MQARISRKLHDRIDGLPKGIRDIARKAQVRLCARYRRLVAAGKKTVVVTTAIAREMIGFIWAIAHQVQPQIERALASQRLAVHPQYRAQLARKHRQRWVLAQLVVIIEVLVAQR
jgi:DNA polymerase III delta subunit